MALKTLHISSNLTKPNSHRFSPSSSPPHQPKLPPRPDPQPQTRVAIATTTKQQQPQLQLHKRSTSLLRCGADLHGCMDEVVQMPKDQTTEIPIVMYPSVVFPGATLQLQAFEFRNRIMMHTLLQQGLRFGVACSGKSGGRMADVGCIVHVLDCERLTDDRFFLTCVGEDRFRVIEIIRTNPYVVARVQVLNDSHHQGSDSVPQGDLGTLMQQVEQHLMNVAMLSDKLNQKPLPYHQGDQLHRLHTAASFSFLIARLFIDDRLEQQMLLQMDDTVQRLVREGMYLERRSKYLAAIAAIKDAFQHLSCNEK